jgi:hypothetical protein
MNLRAPFVPNESFPYFYRRNLHFSRQGSGLGEVLLDPDPTLTGPLAKCCVL